MFFIGDAVDSEERGGMRGPRKSGNFGRKRRTK
jgi:hypothetical protein